MIILQTLLSLASIGLFCAPTGILDLPSECLGHIGSFDEGPSGSYLTSCFKITCFKMLRNMTEFEKTNDVREMIERCQSGKSDVCSYFYILNDKEQEKLCLDLKNWTKLLKRVAVLCYKYRETKLEDMPTEGQDFEDLEQSKSYQEMFNDTILKENRHNEGQVELLKLQRIYLMSNSNSTASTLSMIAEVSEPEPDSETDSEWSNYSRE